MKKFIFNALEWAGLLVLGLVVVITIALVKSWEYERGL